MCVCIILCNNNNIIVGITKRATTISVFVFALLFSPLFLPGLFALYTLNNLIMLILMPLMRILQNVCICVNNGIGMKKLRNVFAGNIKFHWANDSQKQKKMLLLMRFRARQNLLGGFWIGSWISDWWEILQTIEDTLWELWGKSWNLQKLPFPISFSHYHYQKYNNFILVARYKISTTLKWKWKFPLQFVKHFQC
jgi:hypothetical protein